MHPFNSKLETPINTKEHKKSKAMNLAMFLLNQIR